MSFLKKITDTLKEIKQIEKFFITSAVISPTDLLEKVSKILEDSVSFAIAGGFARSIHAAPRATSDIDIIILSKNIKKSNELLIRSGFQQIDTLDYQTPYRIIHKYKFEGRELDIIEFPQNQEFTDFLLKTGLKYKGYLFLGIEGVILTKLCSFRFKDKADIIDILKDKKLNFDIIKQWCSNLKILNRYSFLTEKHENEI